MSSDIGEWSEERPATQDEQEICDEVKPSDMKSKMFKAFAYKRLDMCGGGQYDVKVYLGDCEGVRLIITYAFFSAGNRNFKLKSRENFRILYEIC